MKRLLSARVLTAVLAIALLAGLIVSLAPNRTLQAVAYFSSSTGIYEDDEVRILGVPVGAIDKITPEGRQVRVEFHYDSAQKVPADAKAVIVAPSLVTTRYLQLAPRYVDGPTLADGASIPIDRTAVPVEWDQIKDQLFQLSSQLGPHTGDPNGPLADALRVGADTLRGQGKDINQTIAELSSAMTTLANGSDDIFGTVRNLQVFTSALVTSDEQIVEFGQRLASVATTLEQNKEQLGSALSDLRGTVSTVQQFVADNRDRLDGTVDQLADVTGVLAAQQEDLAWALHVAPTPVVDLYNSIHSSTASLHGKLALSNLKNPADFVCSAIGAAGKLDPQEAAEQCATYLGPLLNLLTMNYPPVAVQPLSRQGSVPVPASPRDATPSSGSSDVAPPVTGPGGLSELLIPQRSNR
ncbi:MCE family protein [Pseudonocardia sp. T1-2H]|uniref:MCE family protein n=1 Tax=Pseudonocardia sp. T1-2H TaxID=3128899 RepID=UPI00310128B4